MYEQVHSIDEKRIGMAGFHLFRACLHIAFQRVLVIGRIIDGMVFLKRREQTVEIPGKKKVFSCLREVTRLTVPPGSPAVYHCLYGGVFLLKLFTEKILEDAVDIVHS
ncbi:hypothetical protein SDC9_95475 [bioreactor metagenome]|uniref:Uncharacterized protein n=1 Tax=bioreactor metagenome TaxID=1076179 RepID=A0A645A7S8_9ZZZZ